MMNDWKMHIGRTPLMPWMTYVGWAFVAAAEPRAKPSGPSSAMAGPGFPSPTAPQQNPAEGYGSVTS